MSLFITGTDTGVGKTMVTAGLAALLKSRGESFCVFKPIQTGSPDAAHPEDPDQIKKLVGEEVETFVSYCFPEPVAPYAADPERTIQPRKILQDFKSLQKQYKTVLVEGAGGIRVPVAKHFEMLDLARMLQLPVVVVARPNLGTINHMLLTVDALRSQRIEVQGVVISGWNPDDPDPAIQTLLATLDDFLPVPLLGTLPVFSQEAGSFNDASVLTAIQSLELI
jgi:dethiobiotin synthetase